MTATQRARATKAAPFHDELIHPRENLECAANIYDCNGAEEEGEGYGCERVKAGIPGRCWQLLVNEGDKLKAGSVLVSLGLTSYIYMCFLLICFTSNLSSLQVN